MEFKDFLKHFAEGGVDTLYIAHTQTQGFMEENIVCTDLPEAIEELERAIAINRREPWSYHQIYSIDINKTIEYIGDKEIVFKYDYDAIEFEEPIYHYIFVNELCEYTVDVRRGKIFE